MVLKEDTRLKREAKALRKLIRKARNTLQKRSQVERLTEELHRLQHEIDPRHY